MVQRNLCVEFLFEVSDWDNAQKLIHIRKFFEAQAKESVPKTRWIFGHHMIYKK
jgi:hypothetical protein